MNNTIKMPLLKALFITALIVANVVTGKVLNIFGFIVPGAVLCYAFTFLASDVVNEVEGPKAAKELVLIGFLASVFASSLIYLTQLLPASEFAKNRADAYDVLLGMNFRFVLASMVAYWVSGRWNVMVFNLVKGWTGEGHKWMRNNLSTASAQILDTSIFITIAFYDVVPNIWWMIISQYIVKVLLTIIETPFFYLLTKKQKQ